MTQGLKVSYDVADFMTSISRTDGVDETWGLTVDFMSGLGASHVGVSLNLNEPEPLLLWTTPQWMSELFLESIYPELDLAWEHCKDNVTPYLGGKSVEGLSPDLPEARRRYLEEITAVDIRTTCSIPVHGNVAKEWGIFDFATDFGPGDIKAFQKEFGAKIYLAAVAAFRRLQTQIQTHDSEPVPLTPSERECLLWLGRGLRNESIAARLGVRPVTVEFHLSNARKKLSAQTREQALATAMLEGFVSP